MITPSANWTTASKKKNAKPVFAVEIEKDWYQSRITDQTDWAAGSGTADSTTKPGSIICQKSWQDIISDSGYGNTVALFAETLFHYADYYAVRLTTTKTLHVSDIGLSAKVADGSQKLGIAIYKGYEDWSNVPTNETDPTLVGNNYYLRPSFIVEKHLYTLRSTGSLTTTLTALNFDIKIIGNDTDYVSWGTSNPMILEPGTYLFYITTEYPLGTWSRLDLGYWSPNQSIRGDSFRFGLASSNYKMLGFHNGVVTMSGVYLTPHSEDDGSLVFQYRNDRASGAQGSPVGSPDSFDGILVFNVFTVYGYAASTKTTAWLRVNDSSGSSYLPSSAGELRILSRAPLGTSVSVQVYGDANGSDAGQVNLGTIADGGSVTVYQYYKFVVTLTPAWYATPEILSLAVYWSVTETVVMSDRAFTFYRPIISSMNHYTQKIDPISCKTSYGQIQVTLFFDRAGATKSISWAEALIRDYYLVGKEISISMGWQGITITDFILLQTGIIEDYELEDTAVTIAGRESFFLAKDPIGVDRVDTKERITYHLQNPADILMDICRMSLIPERNINVSAFDAVSDGAIANWQMSNAFEPDNINYKQISDDLAKLTGIAVVTQNGVVEPVNLFDETTTSVFTFTNSNSKALGRAELNLNARINFCSVRRGKITADSLEKIEHPAKIFREISVNSESINSTGANTLMTIDSDWIPETSKVNNVFLAALLAGRFTSWFAHGVWTLKRETKLEYAYLEIGDVVAVTGEQVIYKDFWGSNTFRCIVIEKNLQPQKVVYTMFVQNPLDSPPANNGTGLQKDSSTTTSITLSWSGTADSFLLIRRNDSAFGFTPSSGVVYTVGQILSDGSKVIQVSSSTSCTDSSSISAGAQYYYALWAYNDTANPNYCKAPPSSIAATAAASEPTTQPTAMVLTPVGQTTMRVSWTAAAGAPYGYIVVRRATAYPTTDPVDNTEYERGDTLGDGTIAYVGTGVTFDDTGLTNGTAYYYEIFSFNGGYSDNANFYVTWPLQANATLTVAEPTTQITGLTSTFVSYDSIKDTYTHLVSWTPASPEVTGVIFVMDDSATISDPVDGTVYSVGDTIGLALSQVVAIKNGITTNFNISFVGAADRYLEAFTYNGDTSPQYRTTTPATRTIAAP